MIYDKYIGLREKLNGPDLINFLGIPFGERVVPLLRIVLFVQKLTTMPRLIKMTKKYKFKGKVINLYTG